MEKENCKGVDFFSNKITAKSGLSGGSYDCQFYLCLSLSLSLSISISLSLSLSLSLTLLKHVPHAASASIPHLHLRMHRQPSARSAHGAAQYDATFVKYLHLELCAATDVIAAAHNSGLLRNGRGVTRGVARPLSRARWRVRPTTFSGHVEYGCMRYMF